MDERRVEDLEDVLRPDPEAVERVVAAALAAPPHRVAGRRRAAVVAGLAAAAALAAGWLAGPAGAPRSETRTAWSLRGTGDVVAVEAPGGEVWLLRSADGGRAAGPAERWMLTYDETGGGVR